MIIKLLLFLITFPAMAQMDPYYSFVLSDKVAEDRDQDGRPDLWRKFDQSGRLKRLTLPGLTVDYGADGLWTRKEEDHDQLKIISTVQGFTELGRIIKVEKIKGREVETFVLTPKAGGGFTTESGKRRSEEGGEYSNVAVHESKETQCLQSDPAAILPVETMMTITKQLSKGVVVSRDCEGVKFEGVSDIGRIVQDVVNEGQKCLRGLGGKQSTRLADELLANVFADVAGREPMDLLKISCTVPEKEANSIYARATDITQAEFPQMKLNPKALNDMNYKQIMLHEMLHMTGVNGKPHVHNYGNHEAPDLAQACATCCFIGDVSIDEAATQKLDLGLKDTYSLRMRSCDVCAGKLPTLSAQQVEYARTELAQGVQTSYKLASFELKKAVVNDPQNAEAWLLLGKALSQVRPKILDRDAKIIMAYREAIALESDPEKKKKLAADPLYKETLDRFTNSKALLEMHSYVRTNQNKLDGKVADKIVDLEVERARVRTVFQVCPDLKDGSACHTQATAAMLNYKSKLAELKDVNASIKYPQDRIYDSMLESVREEYRRHTSLYHCMGKGEGSANECFNRTYGNPERSSISYQDWFGGP